MIILYDNILDSSDLTVPTENLYFSVDNLKETRLSRFYKSIDLISNITIDAGSAKRINSFFIANHNFTNGATITLEGNATDSWGSPAFSKVLTWQDDIIYDYDIDITYQFYRLVFDDSSNPEQVKLGRIMMGVFLEMPPMTPNQTLNSNTTSEVQYNKTGQSFPKEGYTFDSFEINVITFDWIKKGEIKTMFKTSVMLKSVILVMWENEPDLQPPLYGDLNQSQFSITKSMSGKNIFNMTLNFREVF